MSNRASYQRLNPNMSIHKAVKSKQATLAFKAHDGTTFHQITEVTLQLVCKYWPEMKPYKLLLALLNGKSFKCGEIIVSVVYK
jgi:hypothetical protein